jgi:hypothetical protein
MIDPFFLAKVTSSLSCLRVAAAPVGLFGEQKKMISVRGTSDKSGKKLFSGKHFMYTILPYC